MRIFAALPLALLVAACTLTGERPARNPPGPRPPIKEITGPPRSIAIGNGIDLMINPGKLTLQRRMDRDCMAYVARHGIQSKFRTTMYTDHSARVSRAAWNSASPEERNQLIWDIAIHNSCVERQPSIQTIRIRDEANRPDSHAAGVD